MGMDLKPMHPTKDAPRYPLDDEHSPGKVIWGRYNWSGWRFLTDKLQEWSVDLTEFSGSNDGELISTKTCKAVAKAIEDHLDELNVEDANWLKEHITLWRTCGGYRQY